MFIVWTHDLHLQYRTSNRIYKELCYLPDLLSSYILISGHSFNTPPPLISTACTGEATRLWGVCEHTLVPPGWLVPGWFRCSSGLSSHLPGLLALGKSHHRMMSGEQRERDKETEREREVECYMVNIQLRLETSEIQGRAEYWQSLLRSL